MAGILEIIQIEELYSVDTI